MDDWDNIIQRQCEQLRIREENFLRDFRHSMPEKLAEIKTLDSPDLLTMFEGLCGFHSPDPRVLKLTVKLKRTVQHELLRRLGGLSHAE